MKYAAYIPSFISSLSPSSSINGPQIFKISIFVHLWIHNLLWSEFIHPLVKVFHPPRLALNATAIIVYMFLVLPLHAKAEMRALLVKTLNIIWRGQACFTHVSHSKGELSQALSWIINTNFTENARLLRTLRHHSIDDMLLSGAKEILIVVLWMPMTCIRDELDLIARVWLGLFYSWSSEADLRMWYRARVDSV